MKHQQTVPFARALLNLSRKLRIDPAAFASYTVFTVLGIRQMFLSLLGSRSSHLIVRLTLWR